jgi:recombination protein RecA
MTRKIKTEETMANEDFMEILQKQFKEITTVSSTSYSVVPYYIDSGNLVLNWIISEKFLGGYPAGRIIEIFGDPGTAKTTVGLTFLAQVQKMGGVAMIDDVEGTYSSKFGEILGIDNSKLLNISKEDGVGSRTVEEVRDRLVKLIELRSKNKDNKQPFGYLVDSIGALTTEHEIDNVDKVDMTKAKQLNKMMRICAEGCLKNNITVVLLNHVYTKTDGFFPTKVSSGGEGVKFYSSVRLTIKRKPNQWVDRKKTIEIGSELTVNCVKNNIAPSGRVGKFEVNYRTGIDRYSGLFQTLETLGMIEKIEGSYMFRFTNVADEVRFKRTNPEEFHRLIEERPELLKINY